MASRIEDKRNLLPYVRFDLDRCIACARRVNPDIRLLKISARTGEGSTPGTSGS